MLVTPSVPCPHISQPDVVLKRVQIPQEICKTIVAAGPMLYADKVNAAIEWLYKMFPEDTSHLEKVEKFLRGLPPMTIGGFELTYDLT